MRGTDSGRSDRSLVSWKFDDPSSRQDLLSLWYQFKRDEEAEDMLILQSWGSEGQPTVNRKRRQGTREAELKYTNDFLLVIGKERVSARLYESWIQRESIQSGLAPVYVGGGYTDERSGLVMINRAYSEMRKENERRRWLQESLLFVGHLMNQANFDLFQSSNCMQRNLAVFPLPFLPPAETATQRSVWHDMAIFMRQLVQDIILRIEGNAVLRPSAAPEIDKIYPSEEDEQERFHHPFFASVFVESGLGSEEKAYVCIIPAFAAARTSELGFRTS